MVRVEKKIGGAGGGMEFQWFGANAKSKLAEYVKVRMDGRVREEGVEEGEGG